MFNDKNILEIRLDTSIPSSLVKELMVFVKIPFLKIFESSAKKQKINLVKKIFNPCLNLSDFKKYFLSKIIESKSLPNLLAALISIKLYLISSFFSKPIRGKKNSKFFDNSLILISKLSPFFKSFDKKV